MPNFACPYCGVMSRFTATSLWLEGKWPDGHQRAVTMLVCPNPVCRGIVMAASGDDFGYEDFDPVGILPEQAVAEPDARIPAPIRADLFEARRCATVRANKAVATLCRRALQGAVLDQGATPKKRLHEQIDEVVAANKVHASLKEWADAIRFVGNSGAHPGEDGLEDVTEEEAEDILAFTEEFLQLTYVARERVRQRLAARTATAPE
jgi:hypothetical protein